jgi:hypothetical protein
MKTKPSHNAFVVSEYTVGTEKHSAWRKIGVAFAHKDGQGFDVILEAVPVSGKLTLRVPKPDEEVAN